MVLEKYDRPHVLDLILKFHEWIKIHIESWPLLTREKLRRDWKMRYEEKFLSSGMFQVLSSCNSGIEFPWVFSSYTIYYYYC